MPIYASQIPILIPASFSPVVAAEFYKGKARRKSRKTKESKKD